MKISKIKEHLEKIKVSINKISGEDSLNEIEKIAEKNQISNDDIEILKKYNKSIENIDKLTGFEIFAILEPFEVKEIKEEKKEKLTLNYEIKITPDELKCFLTIKKIDDLKLKPSDIIKILNENKVTHCILENAIEKICEKYNKGEDIIEELVADGYKPEVGNDATIDFKFKNDEELVNIYLNEKFKLLKESESNKDLKFEDFFKQEYSKILSGYVKKGEVIAKKINATKGKDGLTVTGKIISGRFGEDKNIRIRRNVKFKNETGEYISEIDGVVIYDNGLIWVKRFEPGKFKLELSEDEMNLYLTVIPSVGGANRVQIEDVLNEIKNLKIKIEIDKRKIEETIEEAEKNHKITRKKICEGILPENGEDGYIEYKIKLASGKRFKELEDGRIDFYEQDLITLVKKDELIAIVYNPKEGKKDGMTLTGKILPAESGKPYKFEVQKNIKVLEFSDRKELYSEIDGHLKIDENRLSVLPVYVVEEDVSFKTGNIKFTGDVIIKGDIKENFKVIAEGDIFINGNAEACTIIGKRDVIIKGGIIGKNKGKILSNRNIYAKFAENSYLEASNDIVIEESIAGSEIFTNSNLILRSGKGQIVNSKITAGKKIVANIIGSKTGSKVNLNVGYNFKILNGLNQIELEEKEHLNKLVEVEKIIKSLTISYPDLQNASNEVKKLYAESIKIKGFIASILKNLKKKENDLLKNLIIEPSPEILVFDTIYSDVKINYCGKIFNLNEEYKNVIIKKVDDKIKIIPKKIEKV